MYLSINDNLYIKKKKKTMIYKIKNVKLLNKIKCKIIILKKIGIKPQSSVGLYYNLWSTK